MVMKKDKNNTIKVIADILNEREENILILQSMIDKMKENRSHKDMSHG